MLTILVLLLGCSASYESDLRVLCDAPRASGAAATDPAARMLVIAKYLGETLTNREVLGLITEIKALPEGEKAGRLTAAAAAAGITDCPMANALSVP